MHCIIGFNLVLLLPRNAQCSMEQTSIRLPDGTYRHQIARDDFVTRYSGTIHTLLDSFKATATRDPDHVFLGTRDSGGKYEWQTYAEAAKRISNLASGLARICRYSCKGKRGHLCQEQGQSG